MGGGFESRFPAHIDEVEDIGLPYSWLDNASDASVRIAAVRFSHSPAALRTLRVYAVSYKDTAGGEGIISQAGVLYKECPHLFQPHPVTVVNVGPHSNANWLVILSFTISQPGVYHLNHVRIDYTTQGHKGWQYQTINTTVTVKNPPLPGPRPLPRSAVCTP